MKVTYADRKLKVAEIEVPYTDNFSRDHKWLVPLWCRTQVLINALMFAGWQINGSYLRTRERLFPELVKGVERPGPQAQGTPENPRRGPSQCDYLYVSRKRTQTEQNASLDATNGKH